jgi:hypothetical protein
MPHRPAHATNASSQRNQRTRDIQRATISGTGFIGVVMIVQPRCLRPSCQKSLSQGGFPSPRYCLDGLPKGSIRTATPSLAVAWSSSTKRG